MVRNRVPKTDRGRGDGALMRRAIEEVEKGRPVREVARMLNVNRTTLSRYIKKTLDLGLPALSNDDLTPTLNTRQVFTAIEEDALVDYILTCSTLFHGLGYGDVQRLAYEFADNVRKNTPANWKNNSMAGKDWIYGFMKRHQNLSLRSPEATSIARAQGFNKEAVEKFFSLWTQDLSDKVYGPESIYNLDETGITTVQNMPKIIAAKGTKQVGQISATERGTLVTLCCCVNAVGRALPPVMIFPRVHYKECMTADAPPGTLGLATPSGWMNSELFPQVLEHFIKHAGCSPEKPAVLFCDNHESHLSIRVITMARENGLTIITFPPHCSHRLQPLDVSVYGPFKGHFKKVVNEWNITHPGTRITIYDLPQCVTRAFHRAFSYENIVAGFNKTGIFPLNSEIFTDDAFIPSTVFRMQTSEHQTESSASTSQTPCTTTAEMNMSDDSLVDSFHEDCSVIIQGIRPLPQLKNRSSVKVFKRRIVGSSKILTSTPEKLLAEASHAKQIEKENRKIQAQNKAKKRTFAKQMKDKEQTCESDSSHEELLDLICQDSSDFDSDVEESEMTDKDPKVDDFVLIKLTTANLKKAVHYVAKVTSHNTEECIYEVEFYRQSRKMPGRFVKPAIDDVLVVSKDDIIFCLPKPSDTGGTKRMASMLKFSIDLAQYNCQ